MITRLKTTKILYLLINLSLLFILNPISAAENEKPIQSSTNVSKELQKETENKKQTKDKSFKKAKPKNIYLNFENATLSSVINYISEQKNINIIPKKELDNIKVSLTTREALTLEQSWDILLTLLDLNGYTIINVDGLYRIILKPQSKQQPLPIYSGVEPEKLPDNDKVIRYIYFLKNIKAKMVQGFLTTMLQGTVQVNEALDALIITDKCLSIKSAMKIIEELDQGGLRESIKIIKLKHSNSEDVAKLFNEFITPKEQQKNIRFIGPRINKKKPSTYFSRDTKIIPEERQNALILLGIEKNIDKIINFIYKYIDVPIDNAESRLHVKELKYAKAENVKPLLTNIIKPPQGMPKTIQAGEYKFFKDVIIAADSSETTEENKGGGNRLIISCDKDDWKRLKKLINSIDKPQPQIAFEVMVVDIGLTSDFDLWSQFKPKKPGMLGKNINPQFRTAINNDSITDSSIDLKYKAATTSVVREGVAGTNITFGIPGNLWGMIKADLNKDNFNVIIQPHITVNNNQKCKIDSTIERQIPGDFSSKTLASSLVQNKKPKEAKTVVELTPKANLNGTIDLTIHVEITDFQNDDDESDGDTSTRTLNTRINVGTGEVIVLGGLTKSKHEETSYKVPLLGDIPIVGNLFKSKSKRRTKTNLYIFIRPSIIKPRFDGVPDEYTQLKLDYAKHQILENDTYSKEKDPIQRWFFKPGKQSIKQKISDAKRGIFRPIDNYATGYRQPKSVDIRNDKYYRPDMKRKRRESKQKFAKQERKLKLAQQQNNFIQTKPKRKKHAKTKTSRRLKKRKKII
ncbi:hypothetical protein GF385_03005 [Candidatus Dependentiae bacterium]|nr:hypothetical protein [Candidatus Dependentiae bacterium]